jgi:hypothetical protein
MYGKPRVVLGTNGLVSVCGSDEPSVLQPGKKCGSYSPIGFWYKENGCYYADLVSAEQMYCGVNRSAVAHKRVGESPTKKALREFVAQHWNLNPKSL